VSLELSPGTVVVTVPGLRGPVEDHWQTRLAATVPNVRPVPPLGRDNPSLTDRMAALHEAVETAAGPVILVAHSAGAIVTVQWAARYTVPRGRVRGALLATPPDLAEQLPPEYPSLAALADLGWLPIPRRLLPFPSIVAVSANDPLGDPDRVRSLAEAWGSRIRDLGPVGHLNPASGYGDWPRARAFLTELDTMEALR
jgi:predicted alpha/beta hydrolase family esterase